MPAIVRGDITSARGIIVHGCNAQGVMGSGVARAIRDKFPKAYRDYKEHERLHGLKLGDIVESWQSSSTLVVNAITQESYGRDGKRHVSYDAVDECFEKIVECVRRLDCSTDIVVNYPMIGAGLGGGCWKVIEQIINARLDGVVHHRLWIQ